MVKAAMQACGITRYMANADLAFERGSGSPRKTPLISTMKKPDKYLTISQAAKLADVPVHILRRDLKAGIINGYRQLGRQWWRFKESEIIKYAKTIKRESK